jgi:hypothetical protein
VHFSGQTASAVLTDCTLEPGLRCRAVSVMAFERREAPDGPAPEGPGVLVTLYDVTIVSADPPLFVADPLGSGLSHDVMVKIPNGLPHGTASAPNVALEACDLPGGGGPPLCEPAGSVSVDVRWDAAGPTTTSRFHELSSDPFGRLNDRFTSTSRPADASGTVDGVPVDDTALFPSWLGATRFGSVSRFGPLAMSPSTAVAVAAAASVAHTVESTASAGLTNCPPAPDVGTVCEGVFVSALSLTGRVGRQPTERVSVSAALFELTVTPMGLVSRFVGSGVDESATFSLDPDLLGAAAEASIPMAQCDELGCSVQTRTLTVTWAGDGDVRPFRFHSQFAFDGEHANTVGRGTSRDAVAAGTVDGVPFAAFPPITAGLRRVTINGSEGPPADF